jgi:hypothetical protein
VLRVLKPGSILYLAVPDKRYTFDKDRPVTDLDHLFKDHKEGPAWSYRQHVEEWVKLVDKVKDEGLAAENVKKCSDKCYSIHYHVWTQSKILELLSAMTKMGFDFDVEIFLKRKNEMVIVLRKNAGS